MKFGPFYEHLAPPAPTTRTTGIKPAYGSPKLALTSLRSDDVDEAFGP